MTSVYIICESLGMSLDNPHITHFDVFPVIGDTLIVSVNGTMVTIEVISRIFNLEITQKGTVGAYLKSTITTLICIVK